MQQRYVSKELTHFVGANLKQEQDHEEKQYALLICILEEGLLKGKDMSSTHAGNSAVVWINNWGNFSDETQIHTPAVCFCDIPVADLGIHMKKYSKFGLSFPKEFLVPRRANPVFYVSIDSSTTWKQADNRGQLFDQMLRTYGYLCREIQSERRCELEAFGYKELVDKFNDFDALFTQDILAFLKPFDSTKPESDPSNYYMEREWRILGGVKFELSDIQRVILPKSYAQRFRRDKPNYSGQLKYADNYE